MYSIQIAQKCSQKFVQNYNRKRLDKLKKICYNINVIKRADKLLKTEQRNLIMNEQRIMTVVLTNGEKRTSVDTNIMVLINKYFDMLYSEKHIIGCTIKTPTGFTLAAFRGTHKI